MAPKKPSAGKKQKTIASSSHQTEDLDMNRFKGQEQFDRFRALEKRKILSERIFDIYEHGDYERFARIVQLRGWEKIVHPPTTYNPVIVREFYANALPEADEPFSYTTMVRGRTIRFDRDAINAYLGNPFTLPHNETLYFQTYVAWPEDRPTFIGGGMAPNADAGEEAGMEDDDEEDDGEGDASMAGEEEEEADSDDD
ncbi:unnamed protein product [Trifolium pratense]|uniref:Uncharacterized protein n=1 Tax=Trifolium pratense TaxID=57577 RepID=A0ACB0L719_TRIPR|nr:unnamed protein product [Trifolium pratense]